MINVATLDYPKTRECLTCCCCGGPKDKGLLVCWPCYRFHDMRNGGSIRTRVSIARSEQYLADGILS